MAWCYIKGRWWIFAIPLTVFTLVGAAMIFMDTIADPAKSPVPPWYESLLFLGIFFILIPWIGTLLIVLSIRRGQQRERDLLERGVRGLGTLISVSETGLYTNDIPQIEMIIDIRSGIHPDCRISHREHVNLTDLHKLVPGRELTVIVDPDDHENILVIL